MGKKLKIAFVCIGNTCRSPMAMFILKDELKKRKIDGVSLSSFGLALTEKEINSYARMELEKMNIKTDSFKPKKLSKSVAVKKDAIICVSEDVRSKVAMMQIENVYSFEQLFGSSLVDPYGNGEKAYVECAFDLKKYMAIFADMIKEIINV